jgi:succinate dehydrogenase/fumarate reductase flavoprotein subunit
MLDATDITATLIQRLSSADLRELRELHNRILDAEQIVRAIVRRREIQERRNERLRVRGLHVASATV